MSVAPIFELLRTAALLAVLFFFYCDLRPSLAKLARWQAELCHSAFFAFFTFVGMQIVAVSAGGTLINFRSAAVLLAGAFGGPVAGLAAAATGILVREFDGNGNTILGIAIVIVCLAIGLAYRHALSLLGCGDRAGWPN